MLRLSLPARTLRRIHLWLTVIWFWMMPVALAAGWLKSVVFVSVLSMYANFVGHFSSWQGARAEQANEPTENPFH